MFKVFGYVTFRIKDVADTKCIGVKLMKEYQKVDIKCEHCQKEKSTCLIGIYKHSVFVKEQNLCKECFDYSMTGGST